MQNSNFFPYNLDITQIRASKMTSTAYLLRTNEEIAILCDDVLTQLNAISLDGSDIDLSKISKLQVFLNILTSLHHYDVKSIKMSSQYINFVQNELYKFMHLDAKYNTSFISCFKIHDKDGDYDLTEVAKDISTHLYSFIDFDCTFVNDYYAPNILEKYNKELFDLLLNGDND